MVIIDLTSILNGISNSIINPVNDILFNLSNIFNHGNITTACIIAAALYAVLPIMYRVIYPTEGV